MDREFGEGAVGGRYDRPRQTLELSQKPGDRGAVEEVDGVGQVTDQLIVGLRQLEA